MNRFSRTVCALVMASLFFVGCGGDGPSVEDPTFTIDWFESQKEEYAVGEEVLVSMVLTNETQEPITVNKRFAVNEEAGVEAGFGEVFFIIKDSANNPLPFLPLVKVWHPEEEDFTTLQPGELTAWIIELAWPYDLSPGEYTVQAIYRSAVVPEGIEAWIGTLSSNTLTLRIEQ